MPNRRSSHSVGFVPAVFCCVLFYCPAIAHCGPQGPSGSRTQTELLKSSDAEAMYVVLETFESIDEPFRQFEAKFRDVVAGAVGLDAIVKYAAAANLQTLDLVGDVAELTRKLDGVLAVIKLPDGRIAICHPKSPNGQLLVFGATQGVEVVNKEKWDGRYLLMSQGEPNPAQRSSFGYFYVGLALLLAITIISYLAWRSL